VIEPLAAEFESLDVVDAGTLQVHSSSPRYCSGKDAGVAVLSDFMCGYSARRPQARMRSALGS
jgi:TRAP-type mannitol/chloroaromatic compound transport system substrate-binding protein